MSIPDLELTARLVGLPLLELWGRYVALGGSLPLPALGERIAGEVDWPPDEELFLAVALDEALADESLLTLQPLAGFLRAGVGTVVEQPGGVPPAAPGSPAQEGGADADALRARARAARVSARRLRTATEGVQQRVAAPSGSPTAAQVRSLTDAQRLRLLDARRLDGLLQGEAQIVWRADADGRVRQDSPTWRAFTGRSAVEWAGHGWLDAVHPTDRRHAAENWRACIAGDVPVRTHVRLWSVAAGNWVLTRVRAVPVHGPDGETTGWVGTNTVVGTAGWDPAG